MTAIKTKEIEAIGNFLNYYRTDLIYIKKFQDFKTGKLSAADYIKKVPGSFYSFLIEFRVIRNVPIGTVNKLLTATMSWLDTIYSDDVDLFAKDLFEKGVTTKIMTSMASKILFLNNPWKILPMDELARKALKQTRNNYTIYKNNLLDFRNNNESKFESCLSFINPLKDIIHNEFEDINDLDIICKNRMIDKLLWTNGR